MRKFNPPSIRRLAPTCALALAIAAASSPASAGPSAPNRGAPVKLLRDENGNPLRTTSGLLTSGNWSGYVLPNYLTGDLYTQASSTWTVPEVTYQGYVGVSSNWVGIGGFCEDPDCSTEDETLIQLGTTGESVNATTSAYWAWYEMLPKASIPTKLKVKPGDVVTASLACKGKCTGKASWKLELVDETTHKTWTKTVKYESPKLSVEYIEEAPYSGGVLPLADFGTVTYTSSIADGADADLSTAQGLVMEDPNGQSSNVSPPGAALDDFAACFSLDSTLATCDAP